MKFLTHSEYWIIGTSLAVLALLYCFLNTKHLSQNKIPPWSIIATACIAPFALTNLLFASQPFFDRLMPLNATKGVDAATNVVFALFGIAATMVAGALFYLVARFSYQRRALEKSIANAEKTSNLATEHANNIQRLYEELKCKSDIAQAEQLANNAQIAAFLSFQGRLRELDPSHSDEHINPYSDLKLQESVLLRNKWITLQFDIHELIILSKNFPNRFHPVSPIFLEYLKNLKNISSSRILGTDKERQNALISVDLLINSLS